MPRRSCRANTRQILEQCRCFGTIVVAQTLAGKFKMRPLEQRYHDDGIPEPRQRIIEHCGAQRLPDLHAVGVPVQDRPREVTFVLQQGFNVGDTSE